MLHIFHIAETLLCLSNSGPRFGVQSNGSEVNHKKIYGTTVGIYLIDLDAFDFFQINWQVGKKSNLYNFNEKEKSQIT